MAPEPTRQRLSLRAAWLLIVNLKAHRPVLADARPDGCGDFALQLVRLLLVIGVRVHAVEFSPNELLSSGREKPTASTLLLTSFS